MRGLLYLWHAFLSLLYYVCIISLCTTDCHKYFLVVTLEPLGWFTLSCESPTETPFTLRFLPFLCSFLVLHTCHYHVAIASGFFQWCQAFVLTLSETPPPSWQGKKRCTPHPTGRRLLRYTCFCPRRTDAIFPAKPNPAQHSTAWGWANCGKARWSLSVSLSSQNRTLGHLHQWLLSSILALQLGQLILSHLSVMPQRPQTKRNTNLSFLSG